MRIGALMEPVWKSLLGLLLAALIMPSPAQAQDKQAREKDAVSEILLILKDRGDISQERYDELMGLVRQQAKAPVQSAMPAGGRPPASAAAPREGEFVAFWKDGPKFETVDKDITFAISGRIHNHYGDVIASDDLKDAFGEIDDSRAFFRRARLGVAGTFHHHFGFKMEFDFAGGDANFTDVFVEAYKLPALGTLTVGHFKEPMSVDEMTSTNNNWFIERSLPNEAFYPGRNTGMMFRNSVLDKHLTYALAGVVDTGNFGDDEFEDDPVQNDTDSTYILVAHLHGSPWVQGKDAVHVGLSYQHLFLNEGTLRYRARPETAVTNTRFVDTGDLDADGADLLVGEFAAVHGPWNFVAEYFWNPVDLGEDRVNLNGYYALVSYFLTGESRPYNPEKGGFGSVKPLDPMDFKDGVGIGAWEMALRYSFLDLDDDGEGIDGGRERNVTVGLNWYPIAPLRFMLDYTWANIDDRTVDGVTLDNQAAHIIQARFQVAF